MTQFTSQEIEWLYQSLNYLLTHWWDTDNIDEAGTWVYITTATTRTEADTLTMKIEAPPCTARKLYSLICTILEVIDG